MDLIPFHGPPAPGPDVPGFAVRTLLGFGGHGEVWLADDLMTGDAVALKVGRRRDGPSAFDASGSKAGSESGWPSTYRDPPEAALLSRIEHPHVIRLRRVVPLADERLALVLDLAAGGSLAALVAARGPLDPGEVTTLLVPLAQALEHLHGRGMVHGDLSPGNVLFSAQGRPLLGDLGVARVLGARAAAVWTTPGFTDPALSRPERAASRAALASAALARDPLAGGAHAGAQAGDPRAGDAWGLAAVGWFALTGHPPDPTAGSDRVSGESDRLALAREQAPDLVALLERCLSAAPAERPPLSELAQAAWRGAPATAVRLVGPPLSDPDGAGMVALSVRTTRQVNEQPVAAPVPTPESSQRWSCVTRARRGMTLMLAVAAGVLVVSWVAPGAGTADVIPPAGSAAAAAPSRVSPVLLITALQEIGQARAAAFATGSSAALAGADEIGSPAHRSDLELLNRLRVSGYRLTGVRYEFSRIRVLHERSDRLEVAAVVLTSAHRQVPNGKGSAHPVPPDGPRAITFTVVDTDDGPARRWRVRSVAAAP